MRVRWSGRPANRHGMRDAENTNHSTPCVRRLYAIRHVLYKNDALNAYGGMSYVFCLCSSSTSLSSSVRVREDMRVEWVASPYVA